MHWKGMLVICRCGCAGPVGYVETRLQNRTFRSNLDLALWLRHLVVSMHLKHGKSARFMDSKFPWTSSMMNAEG